MNRFYRFSAALLALLLLSATAVSAQTTSFSRSLRLGMTGADVLLLQQLLNRDARTAVASSGVGSAGRETTYFGQLTQQAVIRFQELYAAEVLVPVGLTRGTGFVGPSTLAKLRSMTTTPAGTSPTRPLSMPREGPAIVTLSPTAVTAGGTIVVTGLGFDRTPLTVTVGGITITPITGSDATQLIIHTPASLTTGLHNLVITDAEGRSDTLKIRITQTGSSVASGPVISQLSPARGGYGTTVTIHGSGFSTLPVNTLTVGYDVINSVASPDGKTLTFTIPTYLPRFQFTPEQLAGVNASLPFWIYVKTGEVESEPALFTFTFYTK